MVRLEGLEPPTYWFVASHSIQLSYSRIPSIDSLVILAQGREKCKPFFPQFPIFLSSELEPIEKKKIPRRSLLRILWRRRRDLNIFKY